MARKHVKVSDPFQAASTIRTEIANHAQICRESPLLNDVVPIYTLTAEGMKITWAILLLERVMKQLLCFDNKDVYRNHNLSEFYAKLDCDTHSHVEKAFKAYLELYPCANLRRRTPAGGCGDVYEDAQKMLDSISEDGRYVKWRYPEFYPEEVEMDLTNVHLILEIAISVSNILSDRVDPSEVEYRNIGLVGNRLEKAFRNAFADNLDALINRPTESGIDPFHTISENMINSWQNEHGGSFHAFVDYLHKRSDDGVYRHEGLNAVLNKTVEDVECSPEPDKFEMRQFINRVNQDDFDINVLMMR